MRASRQWFRPEKRVHPLRDQSRYACVWCGLRYKKDSEFYRRSREHFIPRSLGGPCGITNVVFAHVICNSKRSSNTDWVPFVEHRNLGQCVRQQEMVT